MGSHPLPRSSKRRPRRGPAPASGVRSRQETLHAYAVTWTDATSRSGWETMDEHRQTLPAEVQSVGFLISRDSKVVRLSQSIVPEHGNVADTLTIPAGWVRQVRRLR